MNARESAEAVADVLDGRRKLGSGSEPEAAGAAIGAVFRAGRNPFGTPLTGFGLQRGGPAQGRVRSPLRGGGLRWWAQLDSNQQPWDYEDTLGERA